MLTAILHQFGRTSSNLYNRGTPSFKIAVQDALYLTKFRNLASSPLLSPAFLVLRTCAYVPRSVHVPSTCKVPRRWWWLVVHVALSSMHHPLQCTRKCFHFISLLVEGLAREGDSLLLVILLIRCLSREYLDIWDLLLLLCLLWVMCSNFSFSFTFADFLISTQILFLYYYLVINSDQIIPIFYISLSGKPPPAHCPA